VREERRVANPSSVCSDFSVVVKLRAPPPNCWRWEIYRAGRSSSIVNSKDFFVSAVSANKAGQKALKLLLSEFQD
jgi:hypothetical protein